MIEDERAENRLVKLVFGAGARLIERGPSGRLTGSVEIYLDGRRLGDGETFRAALAHAQRRLRADARSTKKSAVEMLLADETWREWSDVKLAETAAVSDRFVASMKEEHRTVRGCEFPETTIGKDGKLEQSDARLAPGRAHGPRDDSQDLEAGKRF